MEKILNWLKAHNITSHSISSALIAFMGLYVTNTYGIADITDAFLSHHKKLSAVFMAAVGVYMKYSKSKTLAPPPTNEELKASAQSAGK